MTHRIRFHPAALDEFREAAKRYEFARPGLGDEFRVEVEAFVERAASGQLPGLSASSRRRPRLRKLALHRFPYTLHYELSEGVCFLWAIAHSKRRPGYWRLRI